MAKLIKSTKAIFAPSESDEQIALFEWAEIQRNKYPELSLLFHIPNGGARNAVVGAKLKAEGVKAGVPDVLLPVARGGFHGLFIELKRISGGKLSENQNKWIVGLKERGYCVNVCYGFDDARKTILCYLKGEFVYDN